MVVAKTRVAKALDDLSEEGVIQVFYPEIGAQWIVGVVGQLQLDVLISRLEAEYKVAAALEPAPFDTARWLKGESKALDAFAEFNKANLARDRDGDPVFMRAPRGTGAISRNAPERLYRHKGAVTILPSPGGRGSEACQRSALASWRGGSQG